MWDLNWWRKLEWRYKEVSDVFFITRLKRIIRGPSIRSLNLQRNNESSILTLIDVS